MKLREQDQRLEEVTDTLKNFLSQAEDALLAKELYPYWVSALGTKRPNRRFYGAKVAVFKAVKVMNFSGRQTRRTRTRE